MLEGLDTGTVVVVLGIVASALGLYFGLNKNDVLDRVINRLNNIEMLLLEAKDHGQLPGTSVGSGQRTAPFD